MPALGFCHGWQNETGGADDRIGRGVAPMTRIGREVGADGWIGRDSKQAVTSQHVSTTKSRTVGLSRTVHAHQHT